ncbi:MAG: DUF3810 domain-containing protein [Lachnospiraceae bacterium]|nr:DUF3810 domain-containing protein [Lachnospiraceae bacterium]
MDNTGEKANHKVKVHKMIYAVGVVGVMIMNAASWQSVKFSDWYIKYIFPVWLNTYARLTSKVPFSIGEIMLILAVAVTVFGIGFWLVNLICRQKYKKAVKGFGKFYAWTALAVCYVMTLNCFILYHGTSFSDKYLVDHTEADLMVVSISDQAVTQVHTKNDAAANERTYTKKELAILRDYIVERCNELEKMIPHDDSGDAYYEGDLVEASRQAMIKLGEDYDQLSGFYVMPKYLSFSGFFSQQYIMGYYFPFSMEANINSVMYITNVAPTICHELAHTKGFIYEDDANMIGYLACINSDDLFLQYCGYLSVLSYVNNDFYDSIGKNQNIYKSHVRISNGVAGDNIFLTEENWQEVEKTAVVKTSTVKKVSDTLMDTTLKLNGVEEGMLQYNDVVGQLLTYYDGELY